MCVYLETHTEGLQHSTVNTQCSMLMAACCFPCAACTSKVAACNKSFKSVSVLAQRHSSSYRKLALLFLCLRSLMCLPLRVSIWMYKRPVRYVGSPNNFASPEGEVSLPVCPLAPRDDSNVCHPSVMMIHPRLLPARGCSLRKLIVWHVIRTSA